MKLRLLLLTLLILLGIKAKATHIVGGEFELQHLSGTSYRLTLNLYFDVVNGDPGALDQFITVNFFDKGTNRLIMSQQMGIRAQSLVPYTSIECTNSRLITRKVVYHETITLAPSIFNNQQGYYVVWERCCRNRTINNIVLPEDAAQAFYMEFPPVVKGGSALVNSSPVLFPPLSDYACVNELFYFDFGGNDPDGDSLVYDMVTPLNGYTDRFAPTNINQPRSAPYPEIQWGSSYGPSNQINGSPPMRIEPQTGRLTVKPATTGLFVFGVRCQEFRKGVKIGEVRRDFQLLVLNCPRNESPAVVASERGKSTNYKEGEVLRIDTNGSRCIDIQFTNPDPSEPLVLTARPVNFSSDKFTFGGTTRGTVNTGGSNNVLSASLCFEECFDTEGKVYLLDLIVRDDGCSLPRQDTLRVSFIIDPLPDAPPAIALSTPDRIFNVREGDVINFDVIGTDSDNEEVTLTAIGKDFNLSGQKITFQNNSKGIGKVSSPFSWEIDCAALQKEVYQLEFQVTSMVCGEPVTRTELVEVRTDYPNQVPAITTDKQVLTFELDLNEPFEAKLFGLDLDPHHLDLQATGNGFTLEELGMSFTATGGEGNAEGLFKWNANCAAFLKGDIRVTFALKETACVPSPDQTLTMEFKVKVPDLQAFIPANIFTPNGDGLNDYFEMPTLPETVCTGSFDNIKIYNRWGKEVFSSGSNTFKWDGSGVNDGVYYYVIDYRSNKYKGSVTLVR